MKRLLRGVFNTRPSLPRYTKFWCVKDVLKHLSSSTDISSKDLASLTRHLVTLLCLLSAKRCQTIHCIDIRYIAWEDSQLRINTQAIVKQTRPGHQETDNVIAPFPQDRQLCVPSVLRQYLLATKNLRGDNTKLFISTVRPHNPVSRDTISRWMKRELGQAGVDITQYGAHSTRGAAVSAAKVPLNTILNAAGRASDCSFRKFYNKPVANNTSFSKAILDNLNT